MNPWQRRKEIERSYGIKKRQKWWRLIAQQGGKCFYCGEYFCHPAEMWRKGGAPHAMAPTIDHFIPKALGGKNRADNLVMACNGCNLAKGPLTGTDFMECMRRGKNKSEGRQLAKQMSAKQQGIMRGKNLPQETCERTQDRVVS